MNLESQARVRESQAGDARKTFIVLAAALLATSVYFSFSAGLFIAWAFACLPPGGQATFIMPKENLALFLRYEHEFASYSRALGNTCVWRLLDTAHT